MGLCVESFSFSGICFLRLTVSTSFQPATLPTRKSSAIGGGSGFGLTHVRYTAFAGSNSADCPLCLRTGRIFEELAVPRVFEELTLPRVLETYAFPGVFETLSLPAVFKTLAFVKVCERLELYLA